MVEIIPVLSVMQITSLITFSHIIPKKCIDSKIQEHLVDFKLSINPNWKKLYFNILAERTSEEKFCALLTPHHLPPLLLTHHSSLTLSIVNPSSYGLQEIY